MVELTWKTEGKKRTSVCAIPAPAGGWESWARCVLMVTPASLTATSLAKEMTALQLLPAFWAALAQPQPWFAFCARVQLP